MLAHYLFNRSALGPVFSGAITEAYSFPVMMACIAFSTMFWVSCPEVFRFDGPKVRDRGSTVCVLYSGGLTAIS